MGVWSVIKSSETVSSNRIDAEYFKPVYLNIRKTLKAFDSLNSFTERIIHPSEFTRIYSDNGVTVLRAQNIRPFLIEIENKEVFLPIETISRLPKNKVKNEDILITRTGANFGQVALFYKDREQAVITSHTFILRINSSIHSAYVALFLNTSFGRALINQGMYGSSQPEIAPRFLLSIPIPRFKEDLEKKLSNKYLQAIKLKHDSIQFYSQATQLLERELEGIVATDTDKKNNYLSSYRELVNSQRIDAEYHDNNLKALILRIIELNPTTIGRNFYIGNGYPWDSLKFLNDNTGEPVVRIRDIRPGFIDNECLTSLQKDYAEKVGFSKAEAGDIVIGMDGIKYFYSSIVDSPCLVNQRVCHLKPKSTSSISSEYLSFIINSLIGQAQLLRDMTVATTVGHITNLNVSKMIIPLFSNSFHDEITELIKNSIQAKKQSKLLLQQAKSEVETLIEQAAQTV